MIRPRDLFSELSSSLNTSLSRLSPRERGLVALSAGALLFFIVFVVSVSISRATSKREARIHTKLTQLEEINRLTGNYRAVEAQRNELETKLRTNQIQLFSYLEDLAKRQGIDLGGINDRGSQPSVADPKITEISVEVPLTRITLEKLVGYLGQIESGAGLVKVTRLQIRPRSDEALLDAWLVATTYKLAETP